MTETCEHCHFREADEHPFFRFLMVLVLGLVLYEMTQSIMELEQRVRKLENPPLPPRAARKPDKIEEKDE
jgi:hypothetical protein